jgi:hypothetical protein
MFHCYTLRTENPMSATPLAGLSSSKRQAISNQQWKGRPARGSLLCFVAMPPHNDEIAEASINLKAEDVSAAQTVRENRGRDAWR